MNNKFSNKLNSINKKKNIRINAIAEMISPYKKIADVGCDHGYLIAIAFDNLNITNAIAIDNKIGPLESAKTNLTNYPNIRFSLSNGISDIDNDTEVVILAGMGGLLINEILNNNKEKLVNVKRIIVEANNNQNEIRKFILTLGYEIIKEKIVIENNKYYVIVVFEKCLNDITYTEKELLFGPILIKDKTDCFISYLETTKDKYEKILNNNVNDLNSMNKIKLKLDYIDEILKK